MASGSSSVMAFSLPVLYKAPPYHVGRQENAREKPGIKYSRRFCEEGFWDDIVDHRSYHGHRNDRTSFVYDLDGME
jgi:hypothetical protein